MRVLIISPDEDSISPQQAIEQAKLAHGSYATVIALPSSSNDYASLYFCAQTLLAEKLANILVDSKDKEYYNIAKDKLIEEAITQFREILGELESDIREKINK